MTADNKILQGDREQLLNRYWALANLDPDLTKGNITGQLKALDSLCALLGAAKAKKVKPPLEIYRSGWRSEA